MQSQRVKLRVIGRKSVFLALSSDAEMLMGCLMSENNCFVKSCWIGSAPDDIKILSECICMPPRTRQRDCLDQPLPCLFCVTSCCCRSTTTVASVAMPPCCIVEFVASNILILISLPPAFSKNVFLVQFSDCKYGINDTVGSIFFMST